MSTRALQDGMMLLGFRDPVTDDVLAGGTVEFYSAGTTNAKNAWEEKEKTTAVTSVTLDSSGQAQLYFDGVYKFVVKNSSATIKYTLDNLKYQARNTSTVTKTADYQATADDDYIICDTDTGGAFTITLAAIAGVVAPITIINTGTSSADVTVDGSGAETIDGSATATITDSQTVPYITDSVQWYGAGASTGTTFTSVSLAFGTTITGTESSGVTTIEATGVESTNGTLILDGGTDGTDATFTGGIVEKGSSQAVNVKIIDIGNWDMDATINVSVTHGIADFTKIRQVTAFIRNDAATSESPLDAFSAGAGPSNGGVNAVSATAVSLYRLTGGLFDTVDYDTAVYNRGWLTIWYVS